MVFDRPKPPGKQSTDSPTNRPPDRPNSVTQRTDGGKPKKVLPPVGGGGGNGGNRGNHGNGGNRGGGDAPSPWLGHPDDPNPKPDAAASFVEYLRWMRSPDSQHKDPTKVQILQMAEEGATNYSARLKQLTDRTELIAGKANCFQVQCPWRIRVGGHRGPESILLPAFDALGMPYIPASTLRGVARTQAIREKMEQEDLDWAAADKAVAKWFGHLDASKAEQAGKVIFLDAYPLPQKSDHKGGLAVDMANNIWNWDQDGRALVYSPNPNPFFSLEKATFLIGLRSATNGNPELLAQVRDWLVKGLQSGVGSQVNTGYGSLVKAGADGGSENDFFSVDFSLEGQLIHGQQKFTQWKWNDRHNEWQMRGNPAPEVRPVAFKSMLRYWFRTFALGVLPIGNEKSVENYLKATSDGSLVNPPGEVRALEALLFGSITPQTRGWITIRVAETVLPQGGQNKQSGKLMIGYASGIPQGQKVAIKQLIENLTWMMFHLGGIGQGARRSLYNRQTSPKIRGSKLRAKSHDLFWTRPELIREFRTLFQKRMCHFYEALGRITNSPINTQQLRQASQASKHSWIDAADENCRIVICIGDSDSNKPYPMQLLHEQFHEFEDKGKFRDAKSLCGGAKKDKVLINGKELERKAVPSPIWIADLDDYQVVTIFGATQDPRKEYLEALRGSATKFVQIFPFSNS